jgi:hypothetical protein
MNFDGVEVGAPFEAADGEDVVVTPCSLVGEDAISDAADPAGAANVVSG